MMNMQLLLFLVGLLLCSLPFSISSENEMIEIEERMKLKDNHTVERILTRKELDRSREIFKVAKQQGYLIQGFYHTSIYKPLWKAVFAQQLYVADGRRKQVVGGRNMVNGTGQVKYEWDSKRWASVLRVSKGLYMNVAGKSAKELEIVKEYVQTLNLKYHKKITFNYNFTVDRSTWQNAKPERRKV